MQQPEARPPKKRELRAQAARRREIEDLRWVMSEPQGRRFIWRLASIAGVFDDTLQTDPVLLGRFLGRRSLGHEIYGEAIEECLEQYLLMQREAMAANQREKTENDHLDKEENPDA